MLYYLYIAPVVRKETLMDTVSMKQFAKQRLAQNRWPMVLVALIMTVIAGIADAGSIPKVEIDYNALADGSMDAVKTVARTAGPILGTLSLALRYLILNPLQVGTRHFFRRNIYENAVIEDLSRPLANYVNIILTMLVYTVITAIGTAFCIVPGIILGLGFWLVPYILAENPNLPITEVLSLSWNKMNGHKSELFMLFLSFIGWYLLSIITFGIAGILFVTPYTQQTYAQYADKLLNPVQQVNPQAAWGPEM